MMKIVTTRDPGNREPDMGRFDQNLFMYGNKMLFVFKTEVD